MKSNLRGYAENVLFALCSLILFFLFFEEQVIIPAWLQPVGRMHPLLLHFPIVILLLAMLLEFFRFKTRYGAQELYQDFTAGLLLAGLLFAAITVLMGLFLAQEDGYAGTVLTWHKWLGVGVLFFSFFIYLSRNARWYTNGVAKGGALIITFSLIFAGHYGAILTHGENFVLEPITITQKPVVPLEEAVVFEHVIQPILEQKCVSCHNPDKSKGQLLLTSTQAMLKGGKTGKLFTPGQPEISLLLQRIHLPLDDKKHMPPKSKVQLTPAEANLLYLWVKTDGSFTRRVLDLPARDSLRQLATALLQTPATTPTYNFAAADEETIRKLNNNYRVITPLAEESPALSVNIYNRQAYTPSTLTELNDLRPQIVALELGKMPVSDADLKSIGAFKNLRRLNLNFTNITGSGLAALTTLNHLESLSLAGTDISYRALQQHLPAFDNLKTVVLWNTAITTAEITQLQKKYPGISFIAGFKDDGKQPIKLNPPQVKNSSVIFRATLPLLLHHPVKGVSIRYTTDGTEPDSLHSQLFKKGTILNRTTTLKVRAFKSGWLGSEVAVLNFYKSSYQPDSVRLVYPLNRVHQANGARTFFDEELGTFNANSPAWANNWAGFYKHPLELIATFKQPVTLSAIALNTLIESENNIFAPAVVEVWGGLTPDKLQLLTTVQPQQPQEVLKPYIKLVESSFKPQPVAYLKIIAKPLAEMPAWHRSKGKPALLLIDEIFLN